MSFTIVQSDSAASSGQVNNLDVVLSPGTSGFSVTPGNLLVAVPVNYHGALLPLGVNSVITDSGGNVWQGNNSNGVTVPYPTQAQQMTFNVFWSVVTTGGTLTVHSAPSATEFISLAVFEISGAGGVFSLSALGVGASGTAGPASTGNILVDGSCLVIAAFTQATITGTPWTVGSGYTALQNLDFVGSPLQLGTMVQYLANTSTNPAVPTATMAGLARWVGAGFALTATPAVVTTAYVSKSGTLAIFGTASKGGQVNGTWPLANITAVNADPVIKMNGSVAAIGPATWTENDKNTPILSYLLRCGSVRSIPMSAAGGNYTSPTPSASGGGGSGLTMGTPILAVGITSYTISAAGSGMADGANIFTVPGGTFTSSFFKTNATAYVTVSGGMVTSVVPANGAVQGMGAAYDPTVTSFTFSYNNATITAHVSHYIQSVPVLTPGSGYTSPPTISFTDSTGSGAVAAPIMNGPAATDTCTYTVADGWLTTTFGFTGGATNGAMQNNVGVLEGPNGHLNGFGATPTIKLGGQFGAAATNSQQAYLYFGKNKLKAADVWRMGPGTSSFTLDSKYFPVSWTPGGTLQCQFYADAPGNGCVATGTLTVVYDDEFYAIPSRAPAATAVSVTGASSLVSSTVVGTTVTLTYTMSPQNQVDFSDLEFCVVAPSDGLWHLKNQAGVSDPWIFAPGNTIDRSKPFAADDAMVAALTGPTGTVPACFRAMDTFGSTGGWQNWISGTDFPPTDTFSYSIPSAGNPPPSGPPLSSGNPLPSGTSLFQFARFLNTNPASTTYSWSSPRLYSTDGWANSGTDSFGNYLDMTAGPNGANDNASFLLNAPDPNSVVLELRSTSPHGLRSRQLVVLFADPPGSAMIPYTSFGTLDFPAQAVLFIYVTGPNTIILTYGLSGGTGSVTQTVNSTTEVPVNIGCYVTVPEAPQTIPIELLAGVAASFPGSAPWVNLPQIGDDSIYTTMAQKIAANIGPVNDVILEFGNEHWNFGGPFHEFPSESTAKNLGRYMPPGQTLWGRWPTNNGNIAADGTNDLFYLLKATHAQDVFTTAWVAAGLSATRIKRMVGCQWTSAGGVIKMCGYMSTYSVPAPFGICVAPYQPLAGRNTNSSPVAAFTTAGYPQYAAGNWPSDAINDYLRHTTFYNTDNWGVWGDQFPSLPSGTRMCAYESGYDYTFADSVPFLLQISEDCLNHPSWYDALHCYELAIQQGNPMVPNSGIVLQSYFNLWNAPANLMGMPLWRLGAGYSQPYGRGLSNSFNTPQGGLANANSANGLWPAGYATVNQQPGIQFLRDWNAATGLPAPPPVAPIPTRAAVLVGI